MRARPLLLIAALVTSACGCPETRPEPLAQCDSGCDAPLVVQSSDAPDAPPFFACDGFAVPSDACNEAVALDATHRWSGGHADVVATTPPRLFGWFYRLESDARDRGRARFCRMHVTDVRGDECEPGYECAISGEVVLTSGGGGSVRATFAGGELVEGAWAAPAST
ncbi:hypothetical protein [Sandaracinus amylolyticus]|uniref:Lipoprotein n=1 Tax=Sandaracinus amylolyticus TaxID=927083 RepID=A0A0F6W5I9_9BACT|nr:hypothetical protein [Sandaracinus amylolyticus]AKF08018.1 hypothetical protein DB32_005167 [Sandaracinus amylolyticus]